MFASKACLAPSRLRRHQSSRSSPLDKFVMYYTPYLILFIITVTTVKAQDTPDEDDDSSTVTAEDIEEKFSNYQNRRFLFEENAVQTVDPSARQADPSVVRNSRLDPVVHEREKKQIPFEFATQQLQEDHNLSDDTVANDLPLIPFNGVNSNATRDDCIDAQPKPKCDPNYKYRTINGSCNNLKNPTWGMAITCQRRMLPPYYVGVSGFRESVEGGSLPPPRRLSLNLHKHLNRPTPDLTNMFTFFGQLLDHDFAQTPPTTADGNRAIQCCPPANNSHPQCAPIIILPNDPFYSKHGIRCLNFVRSAICSTCKLGKRLQFQQVTPFIDCSFAYGNSNKEISSLRAKDGTGRMRSYISSLGEELLPQSSNPVTDQCSRPQTNEICFEAGDSRVNQHTTLTALHTIFLREHNRLCDEMRKVNKHWDGNKIFEEIRRIMGAIMQVITYKEYLPSLLGSETMSEYDLWVSDAGTHYDHNENPSMRLEFSTFAFRFGHSNINSLVTKQPLNAPDSFRLLRNEFIEPFPLYHGIAEQLLSGTSNTSSQRFDEYLVPDVTDFLYRFRGNPTGLDLASFNINRGRDHGMPPYVDVVYNCSNGRLRIGTFDELVGSGLMHWKQANKLRKNYKSVRDVDPWPGMLMEIPIRGAVVGPTAACVIAGQFYALKFGDRFYFEHRNQAGSFTRGQIRELEKMTLSKLFCLNTDIPSIAKNAMLFSSEDNPVIRCCSVKGINLNYWRENKSCETDS